MSASSVVTFDEFFIGGNWAAPSTTERMEVISPHSEEVVGSVPAGAPEDIDAAVAAARTAMASEWGRTTPPERAEVLGRLAREYGKRRERIAELQVLEMGCPVSQIRPVMVDPAVAGLEYYARMAETFESEEYRQGPMQQSIVRSKPVGVVGAIIPWNGPTYLSVMKIGPALAAGCAVVLKPAPESPLDSYLMAESAIAAGVPDGVLNIVAAGRETGEHLVTHPDVDKIAFTGSVLAGRRIGELSGARLRPVTLELGGKSAAIILDDADLESTLAGLFVNCFINSGQVCAVDSRVLVSKARVQEFTEAFVEMVRSLPVGDPNDPKTAIGPMVASRQRDRVEGYIKIGVDEGAKIATGGGRPSGLAKGWYVEPTVFTGVAPTMRIAQEEIFGPVISIIPYEDEDHAVAIANSTDYGLAGSIWTSDIDHAITLSSRVETGTIAINGFGCQMVSPFGGVKSSGLGREMGPEGLNAYIELQSVLLPPAQ
jgi:betaine-aldehyde dehydrogenase